MTRLLMVALLAACSYKSPPGGNAPTDAEEEMDAPPPLPDGSCAAASVGCFTDNGVEVVSTCSAAGADPTTEQCPWGCIAEGGAHCGKLQPIGGAVLPAHVLPVAGQTLGPVATTATTTFDTNTGEISGGFVRPPGENMVLNGVEFIKRNNVGIWRMQSLAVNNEIDAQGDSAIAIVALETITVAAKIDLVHCNDDRNPGGGLKGNGGSNPTAGEGVLGGGAGNGADNAAGGGGGGHAGGGGQGGSGTNQIRTAGGDNDEDDLIATLVGGGGGGGGRGGNGGSGGGAIQLIATGGITLMQNGRISAGGCAGQAGQNNKAAGGGGAGGTIVLEAPTVTLAGNAKLAVNGGSGGGGSNGGNGSDGDTTATPATGGNAGNNGGKGGDGAAVLLNGEDGGNAQSGGGGGGGIGRISIGTLTGAPTIAGTSLISPAPGQGSPTKLVPVTVE